MTTELKPCPLTIALFNTADEIEGCGGGNEAEIMRVAASCIMKQRQEIETLNTRATPSPVPELVRCGPKLHNNFFHHMEKSPDGAYVLHSDAAEIIADMQQLIVDYEEVNQDKKRLTRLLDIALHGEDAAARQASLCDLISPAKQLRELVDAVEAELWGCHAKLTEIEKQVPIGFTEPKLINSEDDLFALRTADEFYFVPHYAHPVADREAETIERYRKALDWLNTQTDLEVCCDTPENGDLGDDLVCKVHSVNGGRNDREWSFIAEHTILVEAILLASALSGKEPA